MTIMKLGTQIQNCIMNEKKSLLFEHWEKALELLAMWGERDSQSHKYVKKGLDWSQ